MGLNKQLTIIFLCLYSSIGLIYSSTTPPQGDEIHFLIIIQSITQDRDLFLENNYQNKDYLTFTDQPIENHSVSGRNSHEVSIHDPGLPALLSPAYLLLKKTGITITLSFISALLISKIYSLCLYVTPNTQASLLTSIALGLSLPFIQYSFLIFTEIVAAYFLISLVLSYLKDDYSATSILVSLFILPWLNILYAPISAVLAILITLKHKGPKPLFTLVFSGALFLLFLKYSYLSFLPTTRYQLFHVATSGGNILVNIINVLIDRQYGLLIYSPIFICTFIGSIFLYKTNKKYFRISLFLTALYILPILQFSEWNGGYNPPPARYIVPILPLLSPYIALFGQKATCWKCLFCVFNSLGTIAIYPWCINFSKPRFRLQRRSLCRTFQTFQLLRIKSRQYISSLLSQSNNFSRSLYSHLYVNYTFSWAVSLSK